MNAKVVIQAGGKGTRLYPYTKVLPKPLMPVGDMPILEIVIRQLAAQGFRDLTITVGHLGEMIRLCCGDGGKWGVHIEYVAETKPLGTMGPLRTGQGPGPTVPGHERRPAHRPRLRRVLPLAPERATPRCSIATYQKPVNISLGVLKTDADGYVIGVQGEADAALPVQHGHLRHGPATAGTDPARRRVRLRPSSS